MKVRDLIEVLHDLDGNDEVLLSNTEIGGEIKVDSVEVCGMGEKVVLTFSELDFMEQIKTKHRTFVFARVERDGNFTDCTSTSNVDSKDIDKVVSIIRKSDKQEYKF